MGFSSKLQSGSLAVRALGHWVVSRSDRLIEARVINALERRLPGLMKEHLVPGVQCAIAVGARPTQSRAFGLASIDSSTPLTRKTRFLVSSLAKPVTGLVCLELAAQNKLQLDVPIGEMADSSWAESMHRGLSKSTVRDLLTHSAQIPCRDSAMYQVGKESEPGCRTMCLDQTTPEQWAAQEQVVEHSRTYSGRGYVILQLLIERMFERPFEQIAADVLTDPLCASCDFSIDAACEPEVARDHCDQGRQLPQLWTPSLAASGLVCTAESLANTIRYALQQRHRPMINRLFVRPPGSAATYTCGLHIWKDIDPRVLDHGAARPGMRGVIKVVPDANIVCVMLANSAHGVKVFRTFVGLVEQLGLARL